MLLVSSLPPFPPISITICCGVGGFQGVPKLCVDYALLRTLSIISSNSLASIVSLSRSSFAIASSISLCSFRSFFASSYLLYHAPAKKQDESAAPLFALTPHLPHAIMVQRKGDDSFDQSGKRRIRNIAEQLLFTHRGRKR